MLIVAVDVSTLDGNADLAEQQHFSDEVWRRSLRDGRPRSMTLLTFASSVKVVTHHVDSGCKPPELVRIGDSRALGSLLRHVAASVVADALLSPTDLVVALAGAPSDRFSADAHYLGTLKEAGLIGRVACLAVGGTAARPVRELAHHLEGDVTVLSCWSEASARFAVKGWPG